MPTVLLYNTQKNTHSKFPSFLFSRSSILLPAIGMLPALLLLFVRILSHSGLQPQFHSMCNFKNDDNSTCKLFTCSNGKSWYTRFHIKKKKDLNTRTLLAKNLIIDKATTNLTLILYTLQSPIIEWWSHRWYYHEIIGQLKEMISSKEHIIIYHANTLIVHCAFITNDWLSSYH